MSASLYLPVGPPGCGKSTLREWALQQNHIKESDVVCPDDLRVWLTGDRANQEANGAVFQVVKIVTSNRLAHEQDVWLDATNLHTGDRNKWVQDARMWGAKVTVILFDVDESELRLRNTTREHPVPEVVLDRMIARWHLVRTEWVDNKIQGDIVCSDEVFRKII